MESTLEGKALFLRNFILLVVGPVVLNSLALDFGSISITLGVIWLVMLVLAASGYATIRKVNPPKRLTVIYASYKIPPVLLFLKLHKLWPGKVRSGEA